ncbi:hypothetical protein DRN69_06075 [Candidatus Pacearchaeota archaeon]|nr:MAG: hypothetical protein DRN69_06075 [Candidatus Pacearchaeota archaeon]
MIYLSDFPKIIQIEPTNSCNFSCSMCLLSLWKNKKRNSISLSLFEKIAKETFPHISRLVLYGMGEPLTHKKFLDLLRIARKYLQAEGKIAFTTNGSLFNENMVNEVLENNLVDEIVFSCDTFEGQESLGHSMAVTTVRKNLDYLLKHKKRCSIKVGIEIVVMKKNYKSLEKSIQMFCNKKVDFITISHIYPYKEHVQDEMMYTMLTNEALTIFEESGEKWDELILGVTREKFAESMQLQYRELYKYKDKLVKKERPYSERYNELLSKAKKKNVLLNTSLYLKEKEKLELLRELETIFKKIVQISKKSGVKVILPDIIPSFKNRECPYQANNAVIIRSDGEVVPCFKYLYDHPSYLDYHSRESSFYSFGNVKNNSFSEIWNGTDFTSFRSKLRNMNKNVPYCGNCSFSTNNCFYVTEGQSDCWGNEPFCSECPYSLNLTKCLL